MCSVADSAATVLFWTLDGPQFVNCRARTVCKQRFKRRDASDMRQGLTKGRFLVRKVVARDPFYSLHISRREVLGRCDTAVQANQTGKWLAASRHRGDNDGFVCQQCSERRWLWVKKEGREKRLTCTGADLRETAEGGQEDPPLLTIKEVMQVESAYPNMQRPTQQVWKQGCRYNFGISNPLNILSTLFGFRPRFLTKTKHTGSCVIHSKLLDLFRCLPTGKPIGTPLSPPA